MAKVLLVDGSKERLQTNQRALTRSDYEVSLATSGSFALTMLEWDRPDLIASHVDIPDMGGYELCSVIRSDPKTRDIPFLLLAGSDGPVAAEAARAGVDMVLSGKINPSGVVDGVRSFI